MKLSELPEAASLKPDGQRLVKSTTTAMYRTAVKSLEKYLHKQQIHINGIEDVRPEHIDSWHKWLHHRRDLTVRTSNSYRRSLSTVLKRLGYKDLAEPITQLKEPARKSKAMKDHHLAKLLLHASVRDAFMICLIRDSGIRRGAIPHIKHEDILVYGSEGGGDELRLVARTLQKGDTTVLALARHETTTLYLRWKAIQNLNGIDTEYVFTTEKGTPLSASSITNIFRVLKKRAQLPRSANIFAHALRHRFAQKMLSEYDFKVVSQWLGHSSVVTTMEIYGHRSEEELIEIYYEGKKERL